MAEESTAKILQERLTEYGLVRVLSRQDVSPQIVQVLPLEEAARQVQQGFAPAPVAKKAKKAKSAKAKKVARAKKVATKRPVKSAAKKSNGPSKGERSAVRQPRYWARVKKELHILLCTNNKKYESIRRQLGKEGRTTQIFLATSITSAIGAGIGASATIIGPLVTIGLIALVRVGTNAWCAGQIE